jgi:hypothetical protein
MHSVCGNITLEMSVDSPTLAIIISFAAVVFSFLQWLAGRGAVKAAIRSAEAAERSARASELTLSNSVVAFRKANRAWITIDQPTVEMEYHNERESVAGYKATTTFRNSGQTPAQDFVPLEWVKIVPAPLNPIYDEGEALYGRSVLSRSFLGAGGTYVTTRSITISSPDFGKFMTMQVKVYVYGRATYRDIFGDVHNLKWCYFFDSSIQAAQMCETHNELD